MTTFNLNAGKTVAYPSGGLPTREAKEEPDTHPGMFYPNREADTPLACGCAIPWPIIQAFGGHIHGQVQCSEHGWQPKITQAELIRARREVKRQCLNSLSQSTLTLIPPNSGDFIPF